MEPKLPPEAMFIEALIDVVQHLLQAILVLYLLWERYRRRD